MTAMMTAKRNCNAYNDDDDADAGDDDDIDVDVDVHVGATIATIGGS